MEFGTFVSALLNGTPIAVLAAAVGVIWQTFYTYSRDKLEREQTKRQLELEKQKFEHQKDIERLKFEYEQRRWREELGREITIKLMELRIGKYSEIWHLIQKISFSEKITSKSAKTVANSIKDWRYELGELITEQVTSDAILALQKELWDNYDESPEAFKRLRNLRLIVLKALRTDIGLGENVSGQTIYQIVENRQNIQRELADFEKNAHKHY